MRCFAPLAAAVLSLAGGCSILFEPAQGKRDEIDGGGIRGDGGDQADARSADAAPGGDGAATARLQIFVVSKEDSGQVSILDSDGLFCNEDEPCDLTYPRNMPVELYASPVEKFTVWEIGPCLFTTNQNTATLSVTEDCVVTAYFGEVPL